MTGYGQLSYDLVRPSNTNWSSSQNAGYYYAESTSGGPYNFARGGAYRAANVSEYPGIFSLTFSGSGGLGQVSSFRCVKR